MSGLIRLDAIERLGPLRLIKAGGGGWYNAPAYADLAAIADFGRWRFALPAVALADIPAATAEQLSRKRPCTAQEFLAFTATRTGPVRSYFDASGTMQFLSVSDVMCQDWVNGRLQLALNGPSTNQIVNNTMQGGAAGVFPTGWSIPSTFANNGIAVEVSAPLVVGGIACVAIRYHGTCTGTLYATLVAYQSTSLVAAANGQTWTGSSYLGLAAGSLANVGEIVSRSTFSTNVGTILTTTTTSNLTGTLTGALKRIAITGTATDASTARASTESTIRASIGATIDFTMYFGMPQLEQQPFATPVIPTYGMTVTRAIESARLSPTLEAILQRSAASIVVRGQNLMRRGGRVIGTGNSLMIAISSSASEYFYNGGTPNLLTSSSTPIASSSVAVALAYDPSGRSITRDNTGGPVSSAVAIEQDRSTVWLGRDISTYFADGHYDFVGIAPSRLSDARLTELAVPA